MAVEIVIKGDPEASNLASFLFGLATVCRIYKGNCPACPVSEEKRNSAGIPSYDCRLGLYAEKKAQEIKDGKVITEEDMAKLDVHSRNYTGVDSRFAFEAVGINLLLQPKSVQQSS